MIATETPRPERSKDAKPTQYQKRKRSRLTGAPMKARSVPPWWVSRYPCEARTASEPNPFLCGPWFELKSYRARE